jgi:hypothetical protein
MGKLEARNKMTEKKKKPILNRAQRKALEKVKSLAEFRVLKLEEKKYGVSVRGADGAKLSIVVECMAMYVNSMIEYSNANPDASFGDFSRFVNNTMIQDPS